MGMKDPQVTAAKWQRNLANAGESIKNGVNAVTVNPAEKAAARQQAYADGVRRAVDEGRYARGLRRVTLQSWQEAMISKGASRIAAGASQAQPKVAAFLNKFLPYVEQGKQKLANMPRGDFEQNLARAAAMARHLHDFQYTP
jgi:hypothetical protein